jgi:hypothetical protein
VTLELELLVASTCVVKLKNVAVQCQAEAEIHEEGRISDLMRRLKFLQIERGGSFTNWNEKKKWYVLYAMMNDE